MDILHFIRQEQRISSDTHIIEREQPSYPARVAALTGAPQRLWMRGVLPTGRSVAVVGARAASPEGLRAAYEVGCGLGERGIHVISGGALGIDGAAHTGALDGGGKTVVVLGTGIDVVYPARHGPLFRRAIETGGALVSQFPLGCQPRTWAFPARNRIIAALADACVIIEAGAGSGSLYTASAAREQGRPVIALLGAPGCDRLIGEGAICARSVADVLAVIDGGAAAPPAPPSDPHAARLYNVLASEPCDLGEAAARAGLDASTAMAVAVDLEIGGLIVRTAGGRYARVAG